MTERTFRIGIAGTGIMGQRMLAALEQHRRFRVATLWDPDPEALRQAAAKADAARPAANLVDLIDDADIDIVYVASPPSTHLQIVRAVQAGGRACLCEKPLSADRAEATALNELVSTSGLPFAVNFPLACAAASRRLGELIAGGELGTVVNASIELRFSRWPREWQTGAAGWLAGPAEGGFTREVLSHFVFLAERLFGHAEVADVQRVREPGQAETALRARLVHGAVSVTIDAAVAGDVADHNRFEIIGTRSTAALTGWTRLEYLGQTSDRTDPTPATLDAVAAMLDGATGHGLATVGEAASVVRCIETMLAEP